MVKVPSSCRHSSHGMAPVSPCRRVDFPCVDAVPPLPCVVDMEAPPAALSSPGLCSPGENPNPSPFPPWPPPPCRSNCRRLQPPGAKPTPPPAPPRRPLPPRQANRAGTPQVAVTVHFSAASGRRRLARSRRRPASPDLAVRSILHRVSSRCSTYPSPSP